jgi:twitching motility protein PilT
MADLESLDADEQRVPRGGDGAAQTESPEETVSGLEEHGLTDKKKKKRKRPRIEKYFELLVKLQGSDLHLKANSKARIRLGGHVKLVQGDALASDDIRDMMFEIMTEEQKQLLHTHGASDFAYQLGESDRFRVNMFKARGYYSVAARRVSKNILNFDQLHLPESIYKITSYHQGLVLLAGITGSGKSTTIAAAIDYINKNRSCHIVTLEDPIEYMFEDRKAFINQREIGIDVENFHMGLRYLMRQDPDVVLVGEMRDAETFMAALNAAETGHLVFGTVHASGSAQTITRVLDLLPEESRDLIRQTMVFNLKAVICQKLLPSIKEGIPRVPAVEIMYTNPAIQKLIDEKREEQIIDVVRSSSAEGMLDFNECLKRLVDEEYITVQNAYDVSPNSDELKMRLKGISSGGGGILS